MVTLAVLAALIQRARGADAGEQGGDHDCRRQERAVAAGHGVRSGVRCGGRRGRSADGGRLLYMYFPSKIASPHFMPFHAMAGDNGEAGKRKRKHPGLQWARCLVCSLRWFTLK